MTAFPGAVDATFAAFGIDATYTAAGGAPVGARVMAKRPDTIIGFGETRIHAETATFEVRASEVASPRPGDQLTVRGETFIVQASPSGAIRTGRCGPWISDPRERMLRYQGLTLIERREKSFQLAESNRLLRKLKAALISNFQARTNERAECGTSEG